MVLQEGITCPKVRKGNLLKLICTTDLGLLSENNNVDSSNPIKPYLSVSTEKLFIRECFSKKQHENQEGEIWLLGQRKSNTSACLLVPH